MWFVGMVVGAMIGALLPGSGMVLAGAAVGAIAGALFGARSNSQSEHAKSLDALSARLADISARLAIVEARLGIGQHSTPSAAPVTRPAPAQAQEIAATPATKTQSADRPVQPAPAPHTTIAKPAATPTAAAARTTAAETVETSELEDDGLTRLWKWLVGGNILAKIGVVLLFFGVASGLRLAAQYGMLPVPVRLGLAAIAALAMIWFGRDRVARGMHQMFGFALQGGGFAILYLIVYFMLARYQMVGAGLAFVAFAALGTVCVLLAARQDAQSLAGLGISGAFLAPVLASTGSGDYVVLFSYYLLLNVFVVTVNWFKGWRFLNFAAFAFTFLVGMAWGIRSYQPEQFAVIEGFLIAFFLMFSLLPVLMILLDAPGKHGYADGLLFFGTPIAVAGIQQAIVESRSGLAWSATIAGAYYLLLWYLLFRRRDPVTEIAERSHLGIGAVFLTLAIPLAFGVQLSTALWALEGSVLLWYGVRLKRRFACFAGLLLQSGAGVYFLVHLSELDHTQPLFSSLVIDSCVIAAAGLFSARVLERTKNDPDWTGSFAWAALIWGLAWIAHAAWADIDAFVSNDEKMTAVLAVCTVTAFAFNLIGRLLGSVLLRAPAWLLTLAIPLTAAEHYDEHSHLLTGWFAFALPAAFAVQYRVMRSFDHDGLATARRFRHFITFWTLGLAIGIELGWWAGGMTAAAAEGFWKLAAWMTTGVAMIAAVIKGIDSDFWPFSEDSDGYFSIACAPVLLLLGLAVFASGYYSAGWGVPYVPPLNPLEVVTVAAIATIIWWGRYAAGREVLKDVAPIAIKAGYLLGFLLINYILARVAHHWFGVPYDDEALYHSALFQGLVSFVWTCLAIGLMIHASRNLLRANWFIGFGLLAIVGAKLLLVDVANSGTAVWTGTLIGVALLVIAASYFAPRPPAEEARTPG